MTSESAVGQRGGGAEDRRRTASVGKPLRRRNRSAQLAQPQAGCRRTRSCSIPRAVGAGSAPSRSVAWLTFDKREGRVLGTRPPPTSSLWSAGVAHHLPEVVEAAARGAETAKDGIREPEQRTVLVELAEVAHGVAGDVVAEGPRTRCAVPARG